MEIIQGFFHVLGVVNLMTVFLILALIPKAWSKSGTMDIGKLVAFSALCFLIAWVM